MAVGTLIMGLAKGISSAVSQNNRGSSSSPTQSSPTAQTNRATQTTQTTQQASKPVTVQSTAGQNKGSATGPYNANTNFANEEKYLNSLIAGGGGNANWAKQQLQVLNNAKSVYGGTSAQTRPTTSVASGGSPTQTRPTTSVASSSSPATASQPTTSGGGYTAKVTMPDGSIKYGTIVNGTTYMPDGSRPVAGSTVQDASGRLWTVPGATNTNQTQTNANTQGTPVRVFDGLGNMTTGTIINGTTYLADGSPVPVGSIVEDGSGKLWQKTILGGVEISKADALAQWDAAKAPLPEDQTELINELYNKIEQQALMQQQLATQQAIAEQQKILESTEQEYRQLREDNNIQALQTQDNLALRAAQLGDSGGIGQAQYSAVANAADQRLLEINLEQKQIEQEVAQNVASLRAQGNYEAADIALQIGQAKIQALIDEAHRIDDIKLEQYNIDREFALSAQEMQIQNAITKLQLGLFSEADAIALGVSTADARDFASRINLLAQIDLAEAQLALREAASDVGLDYGTLLSGDYTLPTGGTGGGSVTSSNRGGGNSSGRGNANSSNTGGEGGSDTGIFATETDPEDLRRIKAMLNQTPIGNGGLEKRLDRLNSVADKLTESDYEYLYNAYIGSVI